MSDIPFHRTGWGRQFFDHQLPKLMDNLPVLVRELQRLNDNLEMLRDLLAERHGRDD